MGGRQKPKEETKAYQAKQAGIQKRKANHEATKKRRELESAATKYAINELATEAFGPGGLTPERKQALLAVAVGPDVIGDIALNSKAHLKTFIVKARRRFTELAEKYVDTHFQSVRGALESGDFETAAKHSEWALEALGGADEGRVVEPEVKGEKGPANQPSIMVGVNLGGITPHNGN